MIDKIYIKNIATYVSGVEINPKKINFIYGANGTGKSTLSKVLSNELSSSESNIAWDNNIQEEVLVYNRSFVDNNFHNDSRLKGIFTLGKEAFDIQEDLDKKRSLKYGFEEQIIKKKTNFIKLCDDQEELRKDLEPKCWNVQKKYGEDFAGALIGFRSKKKAFCDKCIEYSNKIDEGNIVSYEELKEIYHSSFDKNASINKMYKYLPIDRIKELDSNELLTIPIVGKSETSIGIFIEYLNSSDWVKQGINYAKKTIGKCPYCQQALPNNIQEDIEAYFDKKYEENQTKLEEYHESYKILSYEIIDILQFIDDNRYSYLDYTKLNNLKNFLLAKIEKNKQDIQYKTNALSTIINIESIYTLALEINECINQFNLRIAKNNELVENQNKAKQDCTDKIWKFLAFQCLDDIRIFTRKYIGKERGKKSILDEIKLLDDEIKELTKYIELKESSITSINPTVIAINNILKEFGFNSFHLEVNDEKIGTYKIVRSSGEDACKTLSEGEHNFISFLYFYYLCFGSQNRTGIDAKKVLVIDDPVSSMDSNVLFIVSTLVKNTIRNCKNNERGISQVIVLTHNVFFHKEVTHWGNKDSLPKQQTRYYILRKKSEETTIQEYESNPIKTSYEMLWNELNSENMSSSNMVMNTMRRILEHYFMIIGNMNYEKCIDSFEGADKIICKALVSFINEGSHSVFEDLIFTPNDIDVDNYKRVFKLIFEKLGHIEHYNMMMNNR